MRTAIYVREPSIVTISAKDQRDANAEICCYHQAVSQVAVGTHRLDPGIYLVVSSGELTVSGAALDVQIVANNKDTWPDLKANVIALEPGASVASIIEFFTVAKDISVED